MICLQSTIEEEQITVFQSAQTGFEDSWIAISEGLKFRIEMDGLTPHSYLAVLREVVD